MLWFYERTDKTARFRQGFALNLTWIPSASASSLYAAWQLLAGRAFVSESLAQALAEPARALKAEIEALGCEPRAFFANLIPAAAKIEGNRELAHVAVSRTLGRLVADRHAAGLAPLIGDIERSFAERSPEVGAELTLRGQPLQIQWETRGPGLMRLVARLTCSEFVVTEADAVLVSPVTGGGGWAHPTFNRATIEAVLTDVVPGVPEVLRLAWLVAQLQLDVPAFIERLPAGQAERIGGLALVPLILDCGEQVELTSCDPQSMRAAIEAWLPEERLTDAQFARLWEWRQVYLDSRPSVAGGLLALSAMLAE